MRSTFKFGIAGTVTRFILFVFVFGARFFVAAAPARAQGETTSAIVGQVTDANGGAVPGATVSVTNQETGLERSATTDASGRFDFPQLKPGPYSVKVDAAGFATQETDNLTAGLGQRQTVNFALRIAASKQSVVVSAEAALINPENPNTSTNLNAPAIENLPNPGNDLTYPLQFSAGALINTAGSGNDFVGSSNGYGNVEFNGLPALSNGYIVDGLETNDPLTNLNSGLSTNLVLGLNSIAEVTVNTLSYAVDQGRYGASQVNYVTKSGTNQFHGNLYELWNGSVLNAADYFTDAAPGDHKPRSTVNHFGGSLGGPIVHNKLFFFFDSEWVRIALPIVTPVTVPTVAFQNYVLQQLPLGQTSGCTAGSCYPAEPALVPFYQKMFSLYRNTSGTPVTMLGCPLDAGGALLGGASPDGDGCANKQSVSQSSDDHEQVQTVRIDYNINAKDTAWLRLQSDTGVQAAYTDSINPLFDAVSPQPLYSFAAGYTHVFSQSLVNYFNPAFSWYESLFGPSNFDATLAAFPIVLEGTGPNPFSTVGGLDNTWIQGRRASRVFINDNLAWSRGAHELRFGTNTRILRLNDYDFGEGSVPTVTYSTLAQYIFGAASTASESFPTSANEPFNFLNLDLYAQDTWKVNSKLTWTIGIRDTFNSNPLNPHDEIARLASAFDSISHNANQPLDLAIDTH
ncbi:MAG: carboxypeptidase-like regulatory domain-containing protein, partial [Candidatus Acidiferrales bacterium]